MHHPFIYLSALRTFVYSLFNMAKYLVKSTLKFVGSDVGDFLDQVVLHHQVGGLFITSGEKDTIKEILRGE